MGIGKRHGGERAGFTLMEMLVAVALSAVIMMALFGMFGAVVEVVAGVEQHEEAANSQRVFEGLLFDDLGSVYADKEAEFRFKGSSGSFLGLDGQFLEFCTSVGLGRANIGPSFALQRVEYLLKGRGDLRDVYRRERPNCGVPGEWEWVEVPVLRGVREMEVEYLDPFDWSYVTSWEGDGGRCPRAVRFKVVYRNDREESFVTQLSVDAVGTE